MNCAQRAGIAAAILAATFPFYSAAQAPAPAPAPVFEGHEFYRVSLGNAGRSAPNASAACEAKGMRPLCGYNNNSAFCVALGRGKLPEYGDWAQGNVPSLIGMPAMGAFLRGALVYGNNNWNGTLPANNLLLITGNSLGEWNYPNQTGGDVICVKPVAGTGSWRTSGYPVCDNSSCGRKPYTQSQTVSCAGPKGEAMGDAQCSATARPGTTMQCTGNPGCSMIWKSENFPPCPTYCGQSASTVTRFVGCYPNPGNQPSPSPDSNCAPPKPATTQACPATAACAPDAVKDVSYDNLTFRRVGLGAAARNAANARTACAAAQMRPMCNYSGAQMNHVSCVQWNPPGTNANFEWVYPSSWSKISGMPQPLKDLFSNAQFYGNNSTNADANNLLTNEGGSVGWSRNDRTGGDVICVK
jgi:hypothetical protein